jgi:hypothetical protein
MKNRNITFTIILSVLACFAISPQAQTVCQQGCDTSNANTFLGDDALVNNTTGFQNTATGDNALLSNTTGFGNTASGASALTSNVTGNENTAIGDFALLSNHNGGSNTASGVEALYSNTCGSSNTANGYEALFSNTLGNSNIAVGSFALVSNTTGGGNTATGDNALFDNTTGSNNTANGVGALQNNTGNNNVAVGSNAGINLTTGSNNIYIGSAGKADDTNKIRIGTKGTQNATSIAGISGVTVANGVGVIIDTFGHLGTIISSASFKDDIRPMDKASEAILALKPVTFHYKKELDPDSIPQFGFVAEQVEKVNPDLVARDGEGKPYSVRYEAVNAMLLNEFLKEHKKVEDLEATVASLVAALKEQAAQIQNVSAELELSKPAPQVAINKR